MDDRHPWPRPSASRLPIALAGALAAGIAMLAAVTVARAEVSKPQAMDVTQRMTPPAVGEPASLSAGRWRGHVR